MRHLRVQGLLADLTASRGCVRRDPHADPCSISRSVSATVEAARAKSCDRIDWIGAPSSRSSRTRSCLLSAFGADRLTRVVV